MIGIQMGDEKDDSLEIVTHNLKVAKRDLRRALHRTKELEEKVYVMLCLLITVYESAEGHKPDKKGFVRVPLNKVLLAEAGRITGWDKKEK